MSCHVLCSLQEEGCLVRCTSYSTSATNVTSLCFPNTPYFHLTHSFSHKYFLYFIVYLLIYLFFNAHCNFLQYSFFGNISATDFKKSCSIAPLLCMGTLLFASLEKRKRAQSVHSMLTRKLRGQILCKAGVITSFKNSRSL